MLIRSQWRYTERVRNFMNWSYLQLTCINLLSSKWSSSEIGLMFTSNYVLLKCSTLKGYELEVTGNLNEEEWKFKKLRTNRKNQINFPSSRLMQQFYRCHVTHHKPVHSAYMYVCMSSWLHQGCHWIDKRKAFCFHSSEGGLMCAVCHLILHCFRNYACFVHIC